MVYRLYFVIKKVLSAGLVGIACILLFISCASTSPETSGSSLADILGSNSGSGDRLGSAPKKAGKGEVVITYRNRSSDVKVTLDPNTELFMLDLTGVAPAKRDTVIIADSTLIKQRAVDIQNLLAGYRMAQEYFYLEEYNKALEKVNEILEIQETADAYALKGTIHFMMDNLVSTRVSWNKAVQLNPDLPIPSIPELEEIIKDIKRGNEE